MTKTIVFFSKPQKLELKGEVRNIESIIMAKSLRNRLDDAPIVVRESGTTEAVELANSGVHAFTVHFVERPSLNQHPIGIFTLQELHSEETLLRVPPRREWGQYFEGREGLDLALREESYKEFAAKDGQLFKAYLESLKKELKQHGFISSWLQTVLRWISRNWKWSTAIAVVMLAVSVLANLDRLQTTLNRLLQGGR